MNFIPSFIHRRIGHRPNLVKIVHNIGWLFFDKILRMGVGATVASLVSFFVTTFVLDIFYSKTKKNAVLMVRSFFLCFTIFRKKTWVL
jgi:hypothetical protein